MFTFILFAEIKFKTRKLTICYKLLIRCVNLTHLKVVLVFRDFHAKKSNFCENYSSN